MKMYSVFSKLVERDARLWPAYSTSQAKHFSSLQIRSGGILKGREKRVCVWEKDRGRKCGRENIEKKKESGKDRE